MRRGATLAALGGLLAAAAAWMPQAQAQAAAAGAAAPAAADPEAVQAGRQLYVRNCSHCHGFNMVNPGTVSYDLRRFPKDDPERFFQSVKEGKNAMPAWKHSLSDEQIRQLWAYVHSGGKS